MQKLIKRILTGKVSLVLAVSVTLFIAYFSLIPTPNLPSIEMKQADKLYHFIAYFFLSIAWFGYFYFFRKIQQSQTFNFILVALVLFGIVVEVLQKTLTDYRTFDWWDILSNSVGIGIVYLLFKYNKTKLGKLRHELNV